MANFYKKFSTRLEIYRLDTTPASTAADDADREIHAGPAIRASEDTFHVLDRVHVVFPDPIDDQSALEPGVVGRAVGLDGADQNTFPARQVEGGGEVVSQILQLQPERAVRVRGAGFLIGCAWFWRWLFFGDLFELLDTLPNNIGGATTVSELNAVLHELKKPTTQPSLVEVKSFPKKIYSRQMLRLEWE